MRRTLQTDRRLVFLGALALGSEETTAPAYGADRERDVVGVMERVAPERWRLVQPWPRFETNLDLLEIVPTPAPPPPALLATPRVAAYSRP